MEEEEVHARLPCFLPAVAAAGSRTRRATSAVRICDVADGLKKPPRLVSKIFATYPSYRIFRHMHEVLNIVEKNN